MGAERLFFQEELLGYDKLYGLIGRPLSHSFSKVYFSQKFVQLGLAETHYYELFPLPYIEELPQLQSWYPNLVGLNVTIPYKQEVQPFLSCLDAGAAAVGAVNTIRIAGQEWTGYNTDVTGFAQSLRNLLGEVQPDAALVLGTGGAARAVIYVLQAWGMRVCTVSRSSGKATYTYDQLTSQVLDDHRLIVNTTPLGMSPKVETCPALDYRALGAGHFLFDLVYNPEETEFMKRGSAQGARVENGYEMLVGQAEAAWRIWNALD